MVLRPSTRSLVLSLGLLVACSDTGGADLPPDDPAGAGGTTGGKAGQGGTAGAGGKTGQGGMGGGQGGQLSGGSGQGGVVQAGSGGSAGVQSGTGGTSGVGGMSGLAGSSGSSGSAGTGGAAGASGATGQGGAGSGGDAGSGGISSGASGQAGQAGAGEGGASGGGAGGAAAGASGGAGTGGGACVPVVAAPDQDPWKMRLPSAGFGGIVTESKKGFTDVFLQSPPVGGQAANYTRIGARLQWGGTIVFFGLGDNPNSNVIDANDTGREVQLAVYDPTRIRQPCAADASCATSQVSCGNSITYLGWNPVQGGDECNHGAPVLEHGQQGDALRLVVQPLQWNPDWDRTDCQSSACGPQGRPVDVLYTFELRYLTPLVVEVMSEVKSNEAISHPETGQEFPTMYVSHGGPDLPLLLDAGGVSPAVDNPANDGFFYGNFTSPAPWVSWQNSARNYGVGLGHDQGLKGFQAWRGDGKTAPYFHNVRAQLAFGLPAGGVVRGLSYLALGSFDTIAAELNGLLKKRAPFGHVDAPMDGSSGSSSLPVAGWALDTKHLDGVQVQIDGETVATLPLTQARPDVCAVYPAYDGCPAVGFAGEVSLSKLTPCPHLLRVVATDEDGNTTVLGERVVNAF